MNSVKFFSVDFILVILELGLIFNVVQCAIKPDSGVKPINEDETHQHLETPFKNASLQFYNNYSLLNLTAVTKFPHPSPSSASSPSMDRMEEELSNVLKLLPVALRQSAKRYIASRLRRIVMYSTPLPEELKDLKASVTENNTTRLVAVGMHNYTQNPATTLTLDLETLNRAKKSYRGKKPIYLRNKNVMGAELVPIIPEGELTAFVPGELIASHITKMQIEQIDDSVFGPLKSVTMFPSVMSSILVFNKRYHPLKLAQILKYNFGVEAEPNGLIQEISQFS